MQRVKNPPIPLKNFASIESMREEINEVVAFLQNPGAFQEMGARAPRVCYSDNDPYPAIIILPSTFLCIILVLECLLTVFFFSFLNSCVDA